MVFPSPLGIARTNIAPRSYFRIRDAPVTFDELIPYHSIDVIKFARSGESHGCQMAIARFLDRMCLALRSSGLWLCYATLQNLIPSFPWIAPPRPPPWRSKERRDQILPSDNLGESGDKGEREWSFGSVANYFS